MVCSHIGQTCSVISYNIVFLERVSLSWRNTVVPACWCSLMMFGFSLWGLCLCFIAGIGQGGQMLRSLRNSLRTHTSPRVQEQRAARGRWERTETHFHLNNVTLLFFAFNIAVPLISTAGFDLKESHQCISISVSFKSQRFFTGLYTY